MTFGGQRYASADEGMAAANAACASILALIEPMENPVVSSLRLVRPTNPIVATNGLKSRGIPRDWMVSYLLQISIIEIDCIRAAIEKRSIAEKVTRGFSSTGLHEGPAGGIPVVYLYLPNHDSALWDFRQRHSAPNRIGLGSKHRGSGASVYGFSRNYRAAGPALKLFSGVQIHAPSEGAICTY